MPETPDNIAAAARSLDDAMQAAGYTADAEHHLQAADAAIAAIPRDTDTDLVRAALNFLNNTTGRDRAETAGQAVRLQTALNSGGEIDPSVVTLARDILGPLLSPSR